MIENFLQRNAKYYSRYFFAEIFRMKMEVNVTQLECVLCKGGTLTIAFTKAFMSPDKWWEP